jgi:hypothetical protein
VILDPVPPLQLKQEEIPSNTIFFKLEYNNVKLVFTNSLTANGNELRLQDWFMNP